MSFLIICSVALLASALTFFSGFGLGTLLLPAFALFVPIEQAVGLTAVVHFLNGLFKLTLVGRFADRRVLLRFGLPAIVFAVLGAWLLDQLSDLPVWYSYQVGERTLQVTAIKLVIGILLLYFCLIRMDSGAAQTQFPGTAIAAWWGAQRFLWWPKWHAGRAAFGLLAACRPGQAGFHRHGCGDRLPN